MIRIRLLKTAIVAGQSYDKGVELELDNWLGNFLISRGAAEMVVQKAEKQPRETATRQKPEDMTKD